MIIFRTKRSGIKQRVFFLYTLSRALCYEKDGGATNETVSQEKQRSHHNRLKVEGNNR